VAVLNKRGLVHGEKDEIDSALADFNHAIYLNPNNFDALNNLGNLYFAQNQFGRAITGYTEVLRLKPDYAEAFINRGGAYARQGNLDRAIQDYDQAIRLIRIPAKRTTIAESLICEWDITQAPLWSLRRPFG
jgi:tetratricopeptide (TPR) repeat protein